MTKKRIFIAITVIVVLLIAGGYFFFRSKLQPTTQPINAVPTDAAIILETNNIAQLTHSLNSGKNEVWNQLSQIEDFYGLSSQVKFLDSILLADETLKSLTDNRELIISLHPTAKNKFNFLYILGTENTGIYEDLKIWVEENIQKKFEVKERDKDGVSFFEGELKNHSYYKKFSYAFYDGLFIFSFSSLLVENSVNQLKSGKSILSLTSFKSIYDAKGKNVPASLFINYSNASGLLSSICSTEKLNLSKGMKNIADWSLMDLKLNEELLILYGFSVSSDSVPSYLNIFKNLKPVGFTLDEILPISTSFFLSLGIEKPGVFQTNYRKFLKSLNKLGEYENYLKDFKAKYQTDPEELFRSFMGNEIAFVKTNIKGLETAENTFIIVKTGSGDFTKDKLIELLKTYSATENTNYKLLVSDYILDKDKSFPVYSFPFPEMLSVLFGDVFAELQTKYFAIYKNHLIFANSKKAISEFIYANVLQKVLSLDLDFVEFKQSLASNSSITVWANLANKQDYLQQFLNPSAYLGVEKAFDKTGKFQGLALQFSASEGFIYNNVFLKYNPRVYREDPKTVWESRLDTCVAIKPKFVVNHDSEETEVFVQDMNNTIYLINSTGRVLWKKNLKERILSDVFQIDYFKNGKLQLMFNTKSKIYLIDRLGNNVERFPVELRANATNGISVFDYENNRDYRLFVACNNGKIYAMDKNGSILKGWEFEETEHSVKTPIQFFRISDKDYIVFADSLKTYILDRKGKSRVDVKEYFPASSNNSFFLDKDPKTKKHRLVTTTITGKPVFVYFDGSVEIKDIQEISTNHFFDLNDLDGDGFNDYIFLDSTRLTVMNLEFLPMFEKKFETAPKFPPIFFVFPDNQRRIGIVEQEKNLIHLIESTGEHYEGFPLKGFSLFSIGNMGNKEGFFNLIVGSKNNFLYNYTVN
ncbi:MAG: PQQ-like beta-propeller repeat protein [Bacteroidales bacterium]|nr:PQQ-like beta-propeller repeat protein [Bacteroidales bacterium]